MTRRYVKRFKDRHGKLRHYFNRKGCKQMPLAGQPGEVAFERAYLAALEASEQTPTPEPLTPEGATIARVVDEWERAHFGDISEVTKAGYRSNYRAWLDRWGAALIRDIEPRHVDEWKAERASTPSAANNLLRRLRQICEFAIARGYLDLDPTRQTKKFRIKGGGYHSWTDAEIAAFEARWPVGTKQRLYFALLLFTGQRLGDVVAMTWGAIDGHMIEVVQQKTETRLWIPLHRDLRAILDGTPKVAATILTTDYGQPFSRKSMSMRMRDWCNDAGLPQCSSHGLRKAAARRLAEADCTTDQIKAITGHKGLSEVETYTRGVDQRKQASAAVLKLERKR